MYHEIADDRFGERYALSRDDFRKQLGAMTDRGINGVSLRQWLKGYEKGDVQPAAVITFDDGHASNLTHALPVLQEFGFSATFFVTSGHIGIRDGWMDWGQVAALESAGMDVQAHGHTHRYLTGLSDRELVDELKETRRLFGRHLVKEPDALSFPGGRYNRSVIKRAREHGYRYLCTSRPDLAHAEAALFGRYVIHQGVSDDAFTRLVSSDHGYGRKQLLMYDAKWLLRRIMGDGLYYSLWSLANRKDY